MSCAQLSPNIDFCAHGQCFGAFFQNRTSSSERKNDGRSDRKSIANSIEKTSNNTRKSLEEPIHDTIEQTIEKRLEKQLGRPRKSTSGPSQERPGEPKSCPSGPGRAKKLARSASGAFEIYKCARTRHFERGKRVAEPPRSERGPEDSEDGFRNLRMDSIV